MFNLLVKATVVDTFTEDVRDEFAGYLDDHDEKLGLAPAYRTS